MSADHPRPEAVSFRCGCRASRRPGLRRAALRLEWGLSSAASSATVSCPRAPGPVFERWDGNAPGWIRTNERTNRSFLGRPPLTARRRAHGMRPAGFEPAITPASEGRVRRIISPVRCLATLRAHLLLADLRSVAAELSSARVSSAAHRMAPPGFEPGTPGPKPGRMDRFPTGLPNARTQPGDRQRWRRPRSEDPEPTAPGTRAQRMIAALPSRSAASR